MCVWTYRSVRSRKKNSRRRGEGRWGPKKQKKKKKKKKKKRREERIEYEIGLAFLHICICMYIFTLWTVGGRLGPSQKPYDYNIHTYIDTYTYIHTLVCVCNQIIIMGFVRKSRSRTVQGTFRYVRVIFSAISLPSLKTNPALTAASLTSNPPLSCLARPLFLGPKLNFQSKYLHLTWLKFLKRAFFCFSSKILQKYQNIFKKN